MKTGEIIQGYRLTERLDRGGSERQFYRAEKDSHSFVYVHDSEIETYIELYHHLFAIKIPVPRILKYSVDDKYMIQEDLGDMSLYKLSQNGKNTQVLYRQAIDELIKLQVDGRKNTPVKLHYDREHIRWEQEYFSEFFLSQYCGIEKARISDLKSDFEKLAEKVLVLNKPFGDFLMHRDYQSQNIYVKDGKIRIIDFQSARIGPLTYDLAALLRDAYVRIDAMRENELLSYYLKNVKKQDVSVSAKEFRPAYEYTCLQRNMQALGAFANLSQNKGKKHFTQYIPRGLELLKCGLKGKELRKIENTVSSIKLPR